MIEPASNTSYPSAVEVLPAIGPATRESDPGAEHDVVHDRMHATANAIQQLLGTTEDTDANSVLGRVIALEDGRSGLSTVMARISLGC